MSDKPEPLDGLGIYDVDVSGVSYWVIAVSRTQASRKIEVYLGEVDIPPEDIGSISSTKVPLDRKLTFHGDTKGIEHTAEDWLIIYGGLGSAIVILACSEY